MGTEVNMASRYARREVIKSILNCRPAGNRDIDRCKCWTQAEAGFQPEGRKKKKIP
jgi:hypothetical protein